MTLRWRPILSLVAAAAGLVIVVVHSVAAPLLPLRINVRWRDDAIGDRRAVAENELGLSSGERLDQWTWSYRVSDRSTRRFANVVRHPLVADTHHIDRDTLTLTIDDVDAPEWARRVARSAVFQRGEDWLPAILIAIGSLLVIGAWPLIVRATGQVSSVTASLSAASIRRWHAESMRVRTAAGRTGYILALLTVGAFALRVPLVISGGQYYWGDEYRYEQTRWMAAELTDGKFANAARRLLVKDHPLFRLVALPPALIERVVGEHLRIPSAFFASFSALSIGLLGLIARRLGAPDDEAVLAASLLALSSSFFYYSRHLLPYDAAAAISLLALYIGSTRGPGPLRSLMCGILAGAAFLTYLGYWTMAGCVLVIHVLMSPTIAHAVRRAVFAGLGLGATLFATNAMAVRAGNAIAGEMVGFASNVTQGTFDEGWRLPWEYLWHAEHGLLLVWAAATGWCLVSLRSQRASRTVVAGLLGIALVYVALVAFSVGLDWFVVYGRSARQLVPFLCLVTAAALTRLRLSLPPRPRLIATVAGGVLVLAQAAANFATPLQQVFPLEFLHRAASRARSNTGDKIVAVNAMHLYPGPKPIVWPPRYTVVDQAPHPLQFLPYQYEGYTPEERAALRSTDISMKLLLVPPSTEESASSALAR